MYNEEIEQLIDAALADGEVTERERQILLKKAKSLGIDPDEFEMVLDARIVKNKKNGQDNVAPQATKSNKHGVIKKCPSCGAMIQSFQGVCPECGYAFEDVDANASIRKLAEELEKKGKYREEGEEWDDYEKMASIIKRFPVPNTKADLIELITFIQTQFSSIEGGLESAGEYRKACNSKLQECSMKAKLLFPKDTQLATLVQEINKINKREAGKRGVKKTVFVIIGIMLILLAILVGWKIWCLDWGVVWRVITIGYTALLILAFGIIMITKEV